VICTTDHGIAFPGAKATMTDRGIGVMLIMRGPGGFSGGKASDALVSHIDVFPTICDLLEIDPPEWLQGRSVLPIIQGETDEIRDAVFAEATYHAAYEPQRAIRTPRWKYVRRFGDRTEPVLPNTDDGPSKDLWMEHGWPRHLIAPEQLYDLILDPNEQNNLIASAEHGAIAGRLAQRLERWMHHTADPLLDGPVAPPPGAQYNDPDGFSASEPTLTAPPAELAGEAGRGS
jgi:N-sulfoglucosamine sulfohydrolase